MSDGTLFTKEEFDIVLDTLEERILPLERIWTSIPSLHKVRFNRRQKYISNAESCIFLNEIFLDEDNIASSYL